MTSGTHQRATHEAEAARRGLTSAAEDASSHDFSRQRVNLGQDEHEALRLRLRRVQGQVGAILGMLDDGRQCREIIHVISAARGALDRAGFVLLNRAMRQCASDPDASPEDLAALEKLFLELT